MSSAVMTRVHAATFGMTRRLRGESVRYVRGSISVEISDAVRGQTDWETAVPQDGISLESRSVDWLLDAATLAAGGITTPARGDVITDADGNKHVVLPFGETETLWRWHDRDGRSTYRIHSKERA